MRKNVRERERDNMSRVGKRKEGDGEKEKISIG